MAYGTILVVAPLLFIAIIGCGTPVSSAASNSGVCSVMQSKYVTITQSQQVVDYYTTSTLCWDAWQVFECNETRSRYTIAYTLGSQLVYYTSYQCCSGYEQVTSSPLICQPTCSSGCFHGDCTSPGICQCDDGWEGDACNTDIDECASSNGGCQQGCNNTNGSYICYCNAGSLLLEDGTTCSALCHPGTYSDSGLEPCEECPSYFYQLNYGSSSCDPCDNITNGTMGNIDVCVTSTEGNTFAIIGIVTGSIFAFIIFVALISLTTAAACKKYTKYHVSFKLRQKRDAEVNAYSEVSIKRSSLDGDDRCAGNEGD